MGIAANGHCDPRFGEIREIFEHSFDGDEEIGAAISFVVDGETVIDLWGGHYDAKRTRYWEEDTIVNTYSTTKGMTAPAIGLSSRPAARERSRCAGCSRIRRVCLPCAIPCPTMQW